MNSELDKELLDTAVGMRNAGAERAAVVARLQAEGLDEVAASELVDQIDAQIAKRHGARPADMSAEIASQADSARLSNLAATGLGPEADRESPTGWDSLRQPKSVGSTTATREPAAGAVSAGTGRDMSSTEKKKASEGHVLLLAGMTPETLKEQWIARGETEAAAQQLLDAAQQLGEKNEERKVASKRRMNVAALVVMAILACLGVFGIVVMLQGPTSSELATSITQAACGTSEARILKYQGQVVLLGGEALDVRTSLSAQADGFDELYQSGANGEPDHVVCSVVSLLPITYCDGYTVSQNSIFGTVDDEDRPTVTVQIQAAALIVDLRDMDTYASVESVRLETNARCPLVHRSEFGATRLEVYRPDATMGLAAISELLAA